LRPCLLWFDVIAQGEGARLEVYFREWGDHALGKCHSTYGRPSHSLMSGLPFTSAWAPTIYRWLWAATKAPSMGPAFANVDSLL
jgi:hypothetical protein